MRRISKIWQESTKSQKLHKKNQKNSREPPGLYSCSKLGVSYEVDALSFFEIAIDRILAIPCSNCEDFRMLDVLYGDPFCYGIYTEHIHFLIEIGLNQSTV